VFERAGENLVIKPMFLRVFDSNVGLRSNAGKTPKNPAGLEGRRKRGAAPPLPTSQRAGHPGLSRTAKLIIGVNCGVLRWAGFLQGGNEYGAAD
jgi:hypothetical protein